MASTEFDKKARALKSRIRLREKQADWKSVNLYSRALQELTETLVGGDDRDDIREIWRSCQNDEGDAIDLFRSEDVGVFKGLWVYSAEKVRLDSLVYTPTETGLWKFFVEHAAQTPDMLVVFRMRGSRPLWLLANWHNPEVFFRPLRTLLMIPAHGQSPAVTLVPLKTLNDEEED